MKNEKSSDNEYIKSFSQNFRQISSRRQIDACRFTSNPSSSHPLPKKDQKDAIA